MDDEVLGCGGTIVRHVEEGDDVQVCIVANRAYNHKYDPTLIEREKNSCKEAKKILGYQELIFLDLPDEQLDRAQIDIITPLENIANQFKPDIVYLPHRGDLNQDHQAVSKASNVAFRPFGGNHPAVLRVFEVPSSTDQVAAEKEWPFIPNFYVNIESSLCKKLRAMTCYEKESRNFPHPRSIDGITIYAKKRGMEVGMQASEAFVVVRDVWW